MFRSLHASLHVAVALTASLVLACAGEPPDDGHTDAGVIADGGAIADAGGMDAGLDLTHFEVTVQPSKATAEAEGLDRIELRVTVRRRGIGDAGNLGVQGVVITFSSMSDGVTLTQPVAATDNDGVAVGSVVSATVGEKVIITTGSIGGLQAPVGGETRVTFVPPSPTRLAFVQQPSNAVSGVSIAPAVSVALQDVLGRLVATAPTTSVTLALTDDVGGAVAIGTLTQNTENGVATFPDLRVDRAGAGYTLRASSGTLTPATSAAFAVTAGAASSLAFAGTPLDGIAGEPLRALRVEARDVAGNLASSYQGEVTLAFAMNPVSAALSGTLRKNATAGVAEFTDVSIEKAAAGYSLNASSLDVSPATSDAFEVFWTDAAVLRLEGFPATLTAGGAGSVTVTALDRFQNVVRDYTETVGLLSSDARAVLPTAITYQLGDEGRVTFDGLSLRTAGVQSIEAVQRGSATVRGSTASVVSPAQASRLVFVAPPSNASVRTVMSPVRVALADMFDNVAPTANASVTIALSPASAGLRGTTTVDTVQGVASFVDLQVDNDGNGYLATVSAFGFATLSSTPFNVTDATPPAAPGDFDAVPLGERSMSLSWTAPGDDGVLGTLVQAGAFYRLGVTGLGATTFSRTVLSTDVGGPPTPAAPGVTQTYEVSGLEPGGQYRFVLTATDGAGNVSPAAQVIETTFACPTGYTGATCTECATGYHPDPATPSVCVDICTAPNPCTAPADSCNGTVATQNLNPGLCTVTTPGQFTCDFVPTTLDCALTDEVCFRGACIPPPPSVLVTGLPASTTAGAEANVTAALRQDGATVVGYTGMLRITSSDTRATVNGSPVPFDAPYQASDQGSRTFTVVFKTASASPQTLTFTDVALPLTTGSAQSTVSHGTPAALAFLTAPSSGRVRTALSPAVTVESTDAFGNRATTSTAVIAVSARRDGAVLTLSGIVERSLVAGVATFDGLSLEDEGTGTILRAEPSGGSFAPAVTTAPFTVVDDIPPGPVTDLTVSNLGRTPFALPIEWTSPGDDDSRGDNTTGAYVLRYSRAAITEANFAQATSVATNPPLLQGLPESVLIDGLDADTQYFIALRVSDSAGNSSFAFTQGSTAPCETGYSGPQCQSCANGFVPSGPLCVPICDDNPCTMSPMNFCTANTATTHPATGVCAPAATPPFYSCTYAPTQTDCAATGGRCFGAGVCAPDPCMPSPCTAVPATRCEPDGLQRTTFAPVCTATGPGAFTCAYPPTTATCAPQVCFESQCVAATPPAAGELIISELMATPIASDGEWFEVYNRTTKHLDLAGLTVEFGTAPPATFTVPAAPPRVVGPGRHHVFGQSAERAANGDVAVDTVYGVQAEYLLFSSAGQLRLVSGTTEIDAPLAWDLNFPGIGELGQSSQLSSKTSVAGAFHDKPWFWCAGSPPTPGAANGDCGINVSGLVEYCAIQFPDTLAGLATGQSTPIFARVYKPNVSTRNQSGNDQYPLLEVDLGHGPVGTAPTAWTQWTRATPNPGYGPGSPGFTANDDELQANLSIATGGNFLYGFRARLLDPVTGAPGEYVYCDQNNIANPASSGTYGTVTVTEPLRVVSARASARTKAIVVFHKDVDAASVLGSGSQFTFTGGLTVSAAAPVAGKPREVELTTSSQGAGTAYTVTVAATVTSGGAGVVAPDNTASITGLPLCGVGAPVVISQVYGGGATATSAYKYDYVELHNRRAAPITLTSHTIQYQLAGGGSSAWSQKIDLPASLTLAPGQFYLVTTSGSSGSLGGDFISEFPPTPFAPDLASTAINMSGSAGKVALVSTTTFIPAVPAGCTAGTPGQPAGSTIVDLVGYGTTANCAEGASVAPAPSQMAALRRGGEGCADTNVNSADFSAVDPVVAGNRPRNTASAPIVCCDN